MAIESYIKNGTMAGLWMNYGNLNQKNEAIAELWQFKLTFKMELWLNYC